MLLSEKFIKFTDDKNMNYITHFSFKIFAFFTFIWTYRPLFAGKKYLKYDFRSKIPG